MKKIKIPGFSNAGWIKSKTGLTMVALDLKKPFKTPFSPRRNGKLYKGMSVSELKEFYEI